MKAFRALRTAARKFGDKTASAQREPAAASTYRSRWQMSLRDWLLHHQRNVVFERCRWMGVPAFKNPLDAWILQEIVHEVRPGAIVEIGSAAGGSTLYLAHLLDLLGRGRVISVDLDRARFQARHPRIVEVTGDSGAPETRARVAALCEERPVMVVHDGDHRREPLLADLESYAPLVSVGSYLIVEDGVIDLFEAGDGIGTRDQGPLFAIEEFLGRHPEFVVDEDRERYLVTYNPRGYLKRVS